MGTGQEHVCKGCGLTVQPGYPKCPRCRMPLPESAGPLKRLKRHSAMQGGTAVAEEPKGSWSLIIGGIAIAMGIALAFYVAKGSTTTADAPKPKRQELAEPTNLAPAGFDTANPAPPKAPAETTIDEGELAVDQLKRDVQTALGKRRLWATVTASGGTLKVVSSACEDPSMKAELQTFSASARDLQLASIECRAKHGALVFELKL